MAEHVVSLQWSNGVEYVPTNDPAHAVAMAADVALLVGEDVALSTGGVQLGTMTPADARTLRAASRVREALARKWPLFEGAESTAIVLEARADG